VNQIDKVETPDQYTVVVTTKDSWAPFLYFAAEGKIGIQAKEIAEADGDFGKRFIGTGPYQFDKAASQTDTRMVYSKNTNFWQEGKPYLDAIRTVIIKDDNAKLAAFQTKQLDIYPSVFLDGAEALRKAVPDAQSIRGMGNHGFRVWYNMQVPPFNNLKFRQALSYATDREEFVRSFTKGEGMWGIDGGVPGLFTDDEWKKLAPYDPEKAKQLLKEAGYADNPIQLEFNYAPTTDQATSDILLLQSQFKKVGIDFKLNPQERGEVSRRQRVGDFHFQMTGTGAGEHEPDFYTYSYFHSKSPNNNYNMVGPGADPKLDQLTEATRREPDPAKRKEALKTAVKYIHENGYSLWVYYAPIFFFWQPYVKGYYPGSPSYNQRSPELLLDN
jgi:peptide/nickel transport system substrate-binding protein